MPRGPRKIAPMVFFVETSEFLRQRETFGLDTPDPWALPALRLLFSVPRAFAELVTAWSEHYPGTPRALTRLVDLGFVDYQPGLIIDTTTGEVADAPSRRVTRYRASALGARSYASFEEDLRNFEELFPRTTPRTLAAVVRLLGSFVLEDSSTRFGLSTNHAITLSGLSPRLARWWLARFLELGWLSELDVTYADVREVVPPHWRITRGLCRQIDVVLEAFPVAPQTLRTEFRLQRSRFLDDIDPSRVGLTGATDFDHDVTTQSIVATFMGSPRFTPEGIMRLEPRLVLPANLKTKPWTFATGGADTIIYQPDAYLTAQDTSPKVVNRRVILEYERFQSRRDAWSHVERFLGYLHTLTLPYESANLCFVVDSEQRLRTYVQLLEAFADYTIDYPERLPANPVTLAATTLAKLRAAKDPLALSEWNRITLSPPAGSDTEIRPVLHDPDHSPYGEYFGQ